MDLATSEVISRLNSEIADLRNTCNDLEFKYVILGDTKAQQEKEALLLQIQQKEAEVELLTEERSTPRKNVPSRRSSAFQLQPNKVPQPPSIHCANNPQQLDVVGLEAGGTDDHAEIDNTPTPTPTPTPTKISDQNNDSFLDDEESVDLTPDLNESAVNYVNYTHETNKDGDSMLDDEQSIGFMSNSSFDEAVDVDDLDFASSQMEVTVDIVKARMDACREQLNESLRKNQKLKDRITEITSNWENTKSEMATKANKDLEQEREFRNQELEELKKLHSQTITKNKEAIVELKEELSRLGVIGSEQEKALHSLKNKNDELNEQLRIEGEKISALQKEIDCLKLENSKLKVSLERSSKDTEEREKCHTEQLDCLKQENSKLKESLEKSSKDTEEREKCHSEQIQSLHDEYDVLRAQMVQLEDAVTSLEEEKSKQKNIALQKKDAELKALSQSMKEETEEYIRELNIKHRSELEKKESEYKAELDSLRSDAKEYKRDREVLQKLETEIVERTQEWQKIEEFHRKTLLEKENEYKAELESIRNDAQEEHKRSQEALQKSEAELQERNREFQKLEAKYKAEEERAAKRKQKVKKEKEALSKVMEEMEVLKKSEGALKRENRGLQTKLIQATHQEETAKKLKEKLKEEAEITKKSLLENEARVSSLESELELVKTENTSFISKLAEFENLQEEGEKEREAMKEEIRVLGEKLNFLKQKSPKKPEPSPRKSLSKTFSLAAKSRKGEDKDDKSSNDDEEFEKTNAKRVEEKDWEKNATNKKGEEKEEQGKTPSKAKKDDASEKTTPAKSKRDDFEKATLSKAKKHDSSEKTTPAKSKKDDFEKATPSKGKKDDFEKATSSKAKKDDSDSEKLTPSRKEKESGGKALSKTKKDDHEKSTPSKKGEEKKAQETPSKTKKVDSEKASKKGEEKDSSRKDKGKEDEPDNGNEAEDSTEIEPVTPKNSRKSLSRKSSEKPAESDKVATPRRSPRIIEEVKSVEKTPVRREKRPREEVSEPEMSSPNAKSTPKRAKQTEEVSTSATRKSKKDSEKEPETPKTPAKKGSKGSEAEVTSQTDSQKGSSKKGEQEDTTPSRKTSLKKVTEKGKQTEVVTPDTKKRKRVAEEESNKERTPKKSKKVPYVIAFSSFKDGTEFNNDLKATLTEKAVSLNARIQSEPQFEKSITHVVSPPQSKTMKTLGAVITGRWLVPPEWILKSKEAGQFLPEEEFGRRLISAPFEGKKFFVTKEFKNIKDAATKQGHLNTLVVELGGASIVEDAEAADYIIGTNQDKKLFTKPLFTWSAFLAWILEFLEQDDNTYGKKKAK
eukprot:TRINITY_DN586_c3_g1_i2.p1 TRINITY_DN586_c3_g1~~TRINITY_DN586_c3_g1_i2.p1  ORF type:complete len:1313 (-),score=413.97 TRINITY_DN586_c3_g1_i2:57-3995(-)